MNKLRRRHVIGLAIAISLIILHIALVIIALPIISIVIIDYILCKPKENKYEEKEVPIEENQNIDQLRAVFEKIEEQKEEEKEYKNNLDLRQFKNRKNITKEEVEEYLWVHKLCEGRKEKEIIIKEITKISNLTEEEGKEVLKRHYEKGGYWKKNEEEKRIIEYQRKKIREKEEETRNKINKQKEKLLKAHPDYKKYIKETEMDERHKYVFYYEDWLKEKGYV